MHTITTQDFTNRPADILALLRQGEDCLITENNIPLGQIRPVKERLENKPGAGSFEDQIQWFKDFAARHTLDGLTVRELRNEGRD